MMFLILYVLVAATIRLAQSPCQLRQHMILSDFVRSNHQTYTESPRVRMRELTIAASATIGHRLNVLGKSDQTTTLSGNNRRHSPASPR